jgi:hypothetical protein
MFNFFHSLSNCCCLSRVHQPLRVFFPTTASFTLRWFNATCWISFNNFYCLSLYNFLSSSLLLGGFHPHSHKVCPNKFLFLLFTWGFHPSSTKYFLIFYLNFLRLIPFTKKHFIFGGFLTPPFSSNTYLLSLLHPSWVGFTLHSLVSPSSLSSSLFP